MSGTSHEPRSDCDGILSQNARKLFITGVVTVRGVEGSRPQPLASNSLSSVCCEVSSATKTGLPGNR